MDFGTVSKKRQALKDLINELSQKLNMMEKYSITKRFNVMKIDQTSLYINNNNGTYIT